MKRPPVFNRPRADTVFAHLCLAPPTRNDAKRAGDDTRPVLRKARVAKLQ